MRVITKFKSIPYFWITLIVVSLFLATIFSYRDLSNTNKELYLEQQNLDYTKRIESTIERYTVFSEFLYYKLIDDFVLETMFQASIGDSESKDTQRDILYNYLFDDYQLATDYDYRQLHFHLPNGDSFLRFHAPQTYGDNLFNVRDAIRIVNTKLTPVSGFEEGRIYNGYRFVFPLLYEDNHVGSVEISISIATLIDSLYTIEPNGGYFFIIKSEVVSALVFEAYLTGYFETALSDDYLYDRLVYDQFNQRRTIFPGNQIEDYFRLIRPNVTMGLSDEASFYHVQRIENQFYTTQFINIKNIAGNHVGYILSTFRDQVYRDIVVQDIVVYTFITLFYAIGYIGLFIYIHDKRRIVSLSQVDQLTSLWNRPYFNKLSSKAIEKVHRSPDELSLIVMDIDHFKNINDTYGHLIGDEILKEVGLILKEGTRRSDIVSRWGGEEFAVLLPQTSLMNAVKVAEKVQNLVKNHPFTQSIELTLSYGISSFSDKTNSMNELFKLADKNLYIAKNTGRNKIVYE